MLYADLLLLLTLGLALCFAKELRTMIEGLADLFRGRGPRPPTHPVPVDDSRILNRRRSQSIRLFDSH